MDVFLYILAGVAGLLAVLCVVVALRPADFRVSRSATVAAPADAVFPHINDLRAWTAWSPFEKLDPNMTKTFDGPPSGVGAIHTWAGNSRAGAGRMTIVESRPGEYVRMELAFLRPFPATHQAEFTLVPEAGQTRVTWTMTGRQNFVGKAVCLFMNMDKMVGGEFEKGLAKLKSLVEVKAAAA